MASLRAAAVYDGLRALGVRAEQLELGRTSRRVDPHAREALADMVVTQTALGLHCLPDVDLAGLLPGTYVAESRSRLDGEGLFKDEFGGADGERLEHEMARLDAIEAVAPLPHAPPPRLLPSSSSPPYPLKDPPRPLSAPSP